MTHNSPFLPLVEIKLHKSCRIHTDREDHWGRP